MDIGCGNATLLYRIKKNFPNIKLKGVDKEKKFISVAKKFKGLESVEFEINDIYKVKKNTILYCVLLLFKFLRTLKNL